MERIKAECSPSLVSLAAIPSFPRMVLPRRWCGAGRVCGYECGCVCVCVWKGCMDLFLEGGPARDSVRLPMCVCVCEKSDV